MHHVSKLESYYGVIPSIDSYWYKGRSLYRKLEGYLMDPK